MRPSSKEGRRPRRVQLHLGFGDARGGEVRCAVIDRGTNQDQGQLYVSTLVGRAETVNAERVEKPMLVHAKRTPTPLPTRGLQVCGDF